jgi:hypothetical protein
VILSAGQLVEAGDMKILLFPEGPCNINQLEGAKKITYFSKSLHERLIRHNHHVSASAMVRIWTSMILERGDCVHAIRITPATSSGSSIPEAATPSSVLPFPKANSVFTPPGQMAPTLMPCGRNSLSSAYANPTCANLVAQ